ncbi:putative protein ABCI7, chloroplastic-like [Capsicum annuum]|uniref:uncharacterized protein LOC107850826 n=1 Tax=Capsicum annuum TaxID=4072 RepID=UPI001FB0ED2B|nr:uncharacterized protein LOC107850826 [Capsicum annuum]KAF3649575.1 putative protein ABCI7, chloroplastic-like [Capsicum annuum]
MNEIKSEEEKKIVEIFLKIIGPSPPCRFNVPSSIKVHELRKMIAGNRNMPIENLKLVLRGNVLHDSENGDDKVVQLNNGDSLIVAFKPKPPPKHFRDEFDDDDDDELRFQLPPSTSKWKRKFFHILRDRLKFPDMLLMVLFSVSLKVWIMIVTWFILASIARRYGVAPLFLLATGFGLIFYNLGHRKQGELSAYSVFNEDFRELPGTLNADHIDRDIRAGRF